MFRIVRVRAATRFTVADSVFDSLCVGRSGQNELTTNDRLISSTHARFFVRGKALHVVDLDSRNGTELNGERLVPFEPRSLDEGDVVDIAGRLSFRVELDESAHYPVISVSEPTERAPGEGVLRCLYLPAGLTPALDAGRLLSLHNLVARLTDPTVQRNGNAWLDALSTGAARVLKVPEVLLIQRVGDDHKMVSPRKATLRLYRETLIECDARRDAVAVDLASPELEASDANSTVDAAPMGPLIIGTLCAPIGSRGGGDAPGWGWLYTAAGDAGRRRFDDCDVWLVNALATVVTQLFEALSSAQILSAHRNHYTRVDSAARRLGLTGSTPTLGSALCAAVELADDSAPVLIVGRDPTSNRRYGELLHAIGPRDGAPSVGLVAEETAVDALPGQFEAAVGGTCIIEGIDALSSAQAAAFIESVRNRSAANVRILCTATRAPEWLDDPKVRTAIAATIIRVPALDERSEDRAAVVAALAAAHGDVLDARGVALVAGHAVPDVLDALDGAIRAIAALTEARPVPSSEVMAFLSGRFAAHEGATQAFAASPRRGFHPFQNDAADAATRPPFSPLVDALYRAGLLE